MRHAILEATVPSANGTVDYTAPNITGWDGGGLALIFVSGDTAALTTDGILALGMCDSAGGQSVSAWRSHAGGTGTAATRETVISDHAALILDSNAGTARAAAARAQFSAALPNGVRLNWVDTAGVGARVHKIVVVLIEGFSSIAVGNNAGTAFGFNAQAIFKWASGNAAFVTYQQIAANDQQFAPGIGAALNTTGLPQGAAMVVWDRGDDPATARASRSPATDYSHSSNGATLATGRITAFTATGLTTTGTPRGLFAAMRTAGGVGNFGFACESLGGGTGAVSLTGLGKRFSLIVGMVCAVTSDDTFEADAAALSAVSFFVTDGRTTITVGAATRHNGVLISAGNPTAAYSLYENGKIRLLDDANATAFEATVAGISPTGLDLSVTDGLSGTMFLFGFETNPSWMPAPRRARLPRRARVRVRLRRVALSAPTPAPPALPGRVLRAVLRLRRLARARLRWRPPLPKTLAVYETVETTEAQGVVTGPALRGRVAGPELAGVVSSPGLALGRLSGPGSPEPERNP